MKTVVFTGGGTGGHIYPGLAIIEELKLLDKDLKFVWIGSNNGRDKTIVEKSKVVDKFYSIPCGKLRRYVSFKNVIDVFKIIAGVITAFFLLIKLKPVFLFSKGGFVSVPPCFAAKLLGITVYTHECDFSPGLATKINKNFATKILVSYEETKKFFSQAFEKKIHVTGNPVRPVFFNANSKNGKNFLNIDSLSEKTKNLNILLVIGGSLGSRQINELVWKNLDFLCKNFIVVHQCGLADEQTAFKYKSDCNYENYLVYPFIYEQMADVMACSDVVLSRAGANFLWECAACGKPMVLIPLSTSGSRGDQLENANFFASKGAAVVLSGDKVNNESLITELTRLLDSNIRTKYIENCKSLCNKTRSAKYIAKLIYDEVC